MVGAMFRQLRSRRGLRRAVLAACAVMVLGGVAWYFRGTFLHQAAAQYSTTPTASDSGDVGDEDNAPGDYAARVVAYVHQSQPITRQQLGEYLLARWGVEKLGLLINHRVVEMACKSRNIVVTAAEVDAALAEDLKTQNLNLDLFVKTVLPRYKKSLKEWKEDVIRPRLRMMRLVQGTVTVTDDDLRKAHESVFGEKVECRIIVWPAAQERLLMEDYRRLCDSEQAFDEKAKSQPTSSLASSGGRIKPISRYSMDENLEREAFKLQPGQTSALIRSGENVILLKCDKRIPADTTVPLQVARPKLEKEIRERKTAVEMAMSFQRLKQEANPNVVILQREKHQDGPMPNPADAVAYIYGHKAITREELGEFLISRLGAEKLEFLVNRRILDMECKARNIAVSDAEVETSLEDDLKLFNAAKENFEKQVLSKWGKTIYEWREDIIRPRLMLKKLCEGRVKCTEEELKKCFDSYYGERLECRVILWPPEQAKFAMSEYGRIRDSEMDFAQKAKSQASPTLAAQGGKIPLFGRSALGDEELERAAFELQPGQISPLVGTPQGQVVIKCDKRIPPDTTVKVDQVRDKLSKEVILRKTNLEMEVVFKELRTKAAPRMMIRTVNQTEDLAATSKQLLADLPGATK